jgi:hypothetical protein
MMPEHVAPRPSLTTRCPPPRSLDMQSGCPRGVLSLTLGRRAGSAGPTARRRCGLLVGRKKSLQIPADTTTPALRRPESFSELRNAVSADTTRLTVADADGGERSSWWSGIPGAVEGSRAADGAVSADTARVKVAGADGRERSAPPAGASTNTAGHIGVIRSGDVERDWVTERHRRTASSQATLIRHHRRPQQTTPDATVTLRPIIQCFAISDPA